MTAPFPYFGGKSKAAALLWSRFGNSELGAYVEPFLGSAAVFLNRPPAFSGWVTLNDLDGNVANFWRAVALHPEETAAAASQPVFECDLHARHLAIVTRKESLSLRLMAYPDFCDPQLAGWWAWGACVWIGGGWCAGDGPWHSEPDQDDVATFTLGDAGRGVKRQLPHLGDAGSGVNRQLPHLGDAGRGVNRQLPHLGDAGRGGLCADKLSWIKSWFSELQDSFREARVACGDWKRICSPKTMTRNGLCAVLMDPPYGQTDAVYAEDSSSVSHDVREWCISNGDNHLLRIALCGHDTEHNMEALGWSVETWDKAGGYQGADDRERIWFSPHCVKSSEAKQQDLFA